MVGLQVMNDKIIGLPSGKRLREVFLPGDPLPCIDGVKDGQFFPFQEVGIVGHPLGNDILTFKQIEIEVVDADVADGFGDALYHILIISYKYSHFCLKICNLVR